MRTLRASRRFLVKLLATAVLAGLPTVADLALAAGGNPFICRDIEAKRQMLSREPTSRDLNFLLFEAVNSGCTALIDSLLEAGAAVEARDRFANTPLVLAAAAGQGEAVELLLDRGAKIDHRNLAGSSALLRAAMDNRRRAAIVLLQRGADPNLSNNKKINALHAAAYNGNAKLVSALLSHGADPDAVDMTGKSAAIYAAARGFTEVVDLLVAAGIDLNRRYGNDLTLLMWAAGYSNDTPSRDALEIIRRLVDAGVNIDAADNRGWTALMIAAERNHTEAALFLLERGADTEPVDLAGRRAADLTSDAALRDKLLAHR